MIGIGIGAALTKSLAGDPEDLLINDNFATLSNLDNYSITSPDSTWALSGGNLVVTHSPASGTFANYASYTADGTTQLEHCEHILLFRPTENPLINAGFGVGVQEANAFGTTQSVYAVMRTDQTAASGTVRIYLDTTSKAQSTAIVWSVNDQIRLRLVRNKFAYTAYIKNITTDTAEQSVTWYSDASGSNDSQRIGYPAIVSLGGNCTVQSRQYYSDNKFDAKIAFVGDSITHAAQAVVASNTFLRFAELATQGLADSTDCTVYASSNNHTADILTNLEEIIWHRPENVVLMIGGNDVETGVAQATREANYTSIRDQLVNAGINVIHCFATPRDATDMTAWNTFVNGFTSDTRIDTFTPLATGTALTNKFDEDGTHLSVLGHCYLARTIYNGIKSLYTYSYYSATSTWLTRTSGTFTDLEKWDYDFFYRQSNYLGQLQYLELVHLYAQNNATDSLRNLISATTNATATNAPTFTADTGYAFNGTTQWIDTNFNLSTATLYTQNSGYLAVLVRTNGSSGEGCDLGAFDATPGNRSHMFTRYTGATKWSAAVNSSAPTDDTARGTGLYQVVRTGASAESLRFNSNTSTVTASLTDASTTRPNCTLGVGARNRATGGPVNYSDRQIALIACGSGSINTLYMNYIFRAYMMFKGTDV